MNYKTPEEVIKETTLLFTKDRTDNPEQVSSSLRKEITRQAMLNYVSYLYMEENYSKDPDVRNHIIAKVALYRAKPLPKDQVGY